MKKCIDTVVVLLIALFCGLIAYQAYNNLTTGKDMAGELFCLTVFGALCVWLTYKGLEGIGAGTAHEVGVYLHNGQVVKLHGFHHHDADHIYLLVELIPGKIRLLRLNKMRNAGDQLTVGHLYWYLDKKFRKMPIGKAT